MSAKITAGWPGGVGAAQSWRLVAAETVPADDVERLGWLLKR